jgi:hypothetical protein
MQHKDATRTQRPAHSQRPSKPARREADAASGSTGRVLLCTPGGRVILRRAGSVNILATLALSVAMGWGLRTSLPLFLHCITAVIFGAAFEILMS